jgi:multicomponent Na+:H+ antiporter subunit E
MKRKLDSLAARWPQFFRRSLLLALIWFGLNGKDLNSWLIGAPAVLVAAALSMNLRGGQSFRLRLRGLLPFAAFFLGESLRGGWDVARRVYHRRLPLDPGFIRFQSTLPPGPARHLFVNAVSLLPGTLSAGIDENHINIHAIDKGGGVEESLRDLEQRVSRLFIEDPGAAS